MPRCSDHLAFLTGAGLAAALGVGAPPPAHAQWAVACVNCASAWTQLLQYGDQARQLAVQLQERATQLQMYANMVQNTVALPQQAWAMAQGNLMQVRQFSNAASLLSGNAGSMATRLSSVSSYANQAANLGNIGNQFSTWQSTIGNNVTMLGRTLGLQESQQHSDAAMIERLQAQSMSATGQMQALQAGNLLAGATANQLLQIQSTLSAAAQLQAGNMAVAADRRATEDAAMLRFTQPQTFPTTGYRQW